MISENLLKQFESMWGDSFDYSDAEYVSNKTKIHVRYKKHNVWFWITPKIHLKVRGCLKCDEEFIRIAKEIHGDKYDYSKSHYVNAHTPIEIICPKHDSFFQLSNKHLGCGQGCPQCAGRKPKK